MTKPTLKKPITDKPANANRKPAVKEKPVPADPVVIINLIRQTQKFRNVAVTFAAIVIGLCLIAITTLVITRLLGYHL